MKVLVIMQISSEFETTFNVWHGGRIEWYCTMRSHCRGDFEW